MGTPFITFLEPSKLEGYMPGELRDRQPPTIPSAFLDAMEVREEVFVQEQGVPANNEFDSDDRRSCHWVIYASVNKTEEVEVRDDNGNVVRPRKSSTRSTPVGTVRLVPFPHDPHPVDGGTYWGNKLIEDDADPQTASSQAKTHVRTASLATAAAPHSKPYIVDRPTTFHDGREPYVKLGRLAVSKEFRGHRLAGLLVNTVLNWLKANPTYFNPSIKELGLENIGATSERDIPKWKGLVCAHAQERAVRAWSKWGFQVDEGMGRWYEEGIPHVGMFQRLAIDSDRIRI
ncbi:Acetyltransferase (GNAT) family [Geosmithia morbida]|uniref:Acetyltransferase (GNAT) family n=1 Tax=Geosmithia morbida TaxID=1094350 RepID=A0A9P4Z0J8_9HYPO|nr:Acetyltransferase (GNAT) family [Geosmithia morbida]KAF4126330.1 Acetyltransferase (GNAT) family [Geosmithia morbida]